MTFAEAMTQALRDQGMSQSALARECSISRIAVNRYASGAQLPHLNTAIRISKKLAFSLDALDETVLKSSAAEDTEQAV